MSTALILALNGFGAGICLTSLVDFARDGRPGLLLLATLGLVLNVVGVVLGCAKVAAALP